MPRSVALPLTRALLAAGLAALPLAPGAPLAAQLPRATTPEAVGMSAERLARIPAALRAAVARGDVAGAVALVARDGRIVALDSAGVATLGGTRPAGARTLFRIASMTKPVTSVAAMMLVEEGRLALTDPVSKYLPEFARAQVAVVERDSAGKVVGSRTVAARRRMTVRDLLTHRSGITYGFIDAGPVGEGYRRAGVSDGVGAGGTTLAENVRRLAEQPLVAEPGTRWQYGLSTDVLGRVVEVAAGMPLDRFVRERIFQPLGMHDTGFFVEDARADRLSGLHVMLRDTLRAVPDTGASFDGGRLRFPGGEALRGSRTYFSGGAGLVSTIGDYARFAQMLLDGGALDGVRLLSPKTLELMTASATGDLPPDAVGAGRGFGLGFGILTDLGAAGQLGSEGTFGWSGIFGTDFWVDPRERMIGVLMVNVFPQRVRVSDAFRTMTYQAVTRSYDAPPARAGATALGAAGTTVRPSAPR
jgi:CubicO group peptidase (beta-lactamase class C family)